MQRNRGTIRFSFWFPMPMRADRELIIWLLWGTPGHYEARYVSVVNQHCQLPITYTRLYTHSLLSTNIKEHPPYNKCIIPRTGNCHSVSGRIIWGDIRTWTMLTSYSFVHPMYNAQRLNISKWSIGRATGPSSISPYSMGDNVQSARRSWMT